MKNTVNSKENLSAIENDFCISCPRREEQDRRIRELEAQKRYWEGRFEQASIDLGYAKEQIEGLLDSIRKAREILKQCYDPEAVVVVKLALEALEGK